MDGLNVDPRAEAVSAVAAELRTHSDLQSLKKLRVKFEREKEETQGRLRSVVSSNVEEAQEGFELVKESTNIVNALQASFQSIGELAKSSGEIPHFERVREVDTVRTNLRRCLDFLNEAIDLPTQAREYAFMLDSENNLLEAHQLCMQVEADYAALLNHTKPGSNEREVLVSWLQPVPELKAKVMTKVWDVMANVLNFAVNDPALVVQAVRVVEREDRAIELSQRTGFSLSPSRPDVLLHHRTICTHTLEKAVVTRFHALLPLSKAGVMPMDEFVLMADEVLYDLERVVDDVVPLFPDAYNLLDLYQATYHTEMYRRLKAIVELAEGQSVGLDGILALQSFLSRYNDAFALFGKGPPKPPVEDIATRLMNSYCAIVGERMAEWTERIHNSDLTAPLRQAAAGLRSDTHTNLFSMMHQQLTISAKLPSAYVRMVAEVTRKELLKFASMQITQLRQRKEELTLEYLTAVANNSSESEETLIAELFSHLPEEVQEAVDLADVEQAFHDIAKVACACITDMVMQDIVPLVKKYFTDEWLQTRQPTLDIVETLSEYFRDLQEWLGHFYLRKTCQSCAEELIFSYLTHFFQSKPRITKEFMGKMNSDMEAVTRLFSTVPINDGVLAGQVDVVVAIAGLVEDVEPSAFQIPFSSMASDYNKAALTIAKYVLGHYSPAVGGTTLKNMLESCQIMVGEFSSVEVAPKHKQKTGIELLSRVFPSEEKRGQDDDRGQGKGARGGANAKRGGINFGFKGGKGEKGKEPHSPNPGPNEPTPKSLEKKDSVDEIPVMSGADLFGDDFKLQID